MREDCRSFESARAFEGCKSLTSITLPEGLTEICDSAFENCELPESVVIPESVKTIGNQAFPETTELVDRLGRPISSGDYVVWTGASVDRVGYGFGTF